MSRGIVIARVAALLLLAAATAYALRRWTLIPLRCAHAASAGAAVLEAAEQRGDDGSRPLVRRIRADLDGCECVSPPNVSIPFTLGAVAEATGDPQSAIVHYKRALLIDRRPEIYFALGLAQLDALDRSSAIESFTRACAFHPKLLSRIPYAEIQQEVRQRLQERYPPGWLR